MKKYLPYIIIAVVILGGVGVYFATRGNNDQQSDAQTEDKQTAQSDGTIAKKYTDACKLFTVEEISTALGGVFNAGEEDIAFSTATPGTPEYGNKDLDGSACKFDQEDDGTTASMQQSVRLSTEIKTFVSVDKATTWVNELRNPPTAEGQAAMKDPIEVKGVGDEAFFARVNTGETNVDDKSEALYIRAKNQVIVLTATKLAGVDHTAMQASLTKLAQKL